MKGGVKFFRGNAAAARNYLETDRSRSDDYYLREGSGLAERVVATCVDGQVRLDSPFPMDGDTYERWVAGYDIDTGGPKGRLRTDEHALRFVEVVVNGPKSWSLAAAAHPAVSDAYDAAQSAAADQIITWLAEHATTRVGPRGRQVQVPVEQIEAAVVRHYTSRAGDPHRHLHLQINARVLADGTWRGLHSVGVLHSINAINGIGHAAVMTHPGFRQALAEHGYTLDPESGEIEQLTEQVSHFSARAAQIGQNIDTYEAEWRSENPGQEPGARLRRTWDRRAWADARPDKAANDSGGDDLAEHWREELVSLGHHQQPAPRSLFPTPIGEVNRQASVELILTRLAAKRSAWNAADIRGEAERIIAELNIITEPTVRRELAEDLTARAVEQGQPLIDPAQVPTHIRHLTSRHVLNVEADLIARLSARGNQPADLVYSVPADRNRNLDTGQRLAVEALVGTASLVVIEGAAGAGKTTTLAIANSYLGHHRMLIVAPTRNAAQVAEEHVGTVASSAAALAHAYGFRWDSDGAWSRVAVTQVDPTARLIPGDLLVVDEAAMLDQDTAHALLTIADETGARIALLGDRHQLPAVGRGGLLDLAITYANPQAHLTMDTVHRFTDPGYADLSLLMRSGHDPERVFDTLHAHGHIRLHPSDVEVVAALAAASTGDALVIADTGEQVARINAAARTQRRQTSVGHLHDRSPQQQAGTEGVVTGAGERIGVGDPVVTRRNDPDLDVANRQNWIVIAILPDQSAVITGARGVRTLPPAYLREHVQLGYAITAYGAQGHTVDDAHLILSDATTAAAAYVGMTRGRNSNTAHIVADNLEDARTQWVATFSRDRADLGPTHAARTALEDLDRYGPLRQRAEHSPRNGTGARRPPEPIPTRTPDRATGPSR